MLRSGDTPGDAIAGATYPADGAPISLLTPVPGMNAIELVSVPGGAATIPIKGNTASGLEFASSSDSSAHSLKTAFTVIAINRPSALIWRADVRIEVTIK
jgi:hypothetical protein